MSKEYDGTQLISWQSINKFNEELIDYTDRGWFVIPETFTVTIDNDNKTLYSVLVASKN